MVSGKNDNVSQSLGKEKLECHLVSLNTVLFI